MVELPTMVAGALGVFAPAVIGLIKRKIAGAIVRWIIALLLTAAIGVLGAIMAQGVPSLTNIITWAGTAFGMSQAAWATWRALVKKRNR